MSSSACMAMDAPLARNRSGVWTRKSSRTGLGISWTIGASGPNSREDAGLGASSKSKPGWGHQVAGTFCDDGAGFTCQTLWPVVQK